VLETAWRHGVPVRCVWLDTPLEEAQVNVARRQLLAGEGAGQPLVGPDALFRWQRAFEPPEPDEGFTAIERVPFVRHRDAGHTGRALVCWLDGVLRRSRSGARAPLSPEDVEILPGRAEALARFRAEGYAIAALAWHPELAEGEASREAIEATMARTAALLGGDVDLRWCPHGAGPPRCWCRKPLPGLLVELVARHRLDPARSIYAGRDATDRGLAARLGFAYRDAAELFGPTGA
jgi:histidinol phosphatase-like enzyme